MSYNLEKISKQLKDNYVGFLDDGFKLLFKASGFTVAIPYPHPNDPFSEEVLRVLIALLPITCYMNYKLVAALSKEELDSIHESFAKHLNLNNLCLKVVKDGFSFYIQDTIDINDDGTVDPNVLINRIHRLIAAAKNIQP